MLATADNLHSVYRVLHDLCKSPKGGARRFRFLLLDLMYLPEASADPGFILPANHPVNPTRLADFEKELTEHLKAWASQDHEQLGLCFKVDAERNGLMLGDYVTLVEQSSVNYAKICANLVAVVEALQYLIAPTCSMDDEPSSALEYLKEYFTNSRPNKSLEERLSAYRKAPYGGVYLC